MTGHSHRASEEIPPSPPGWWRRTAEWMGALLGFLLLPWLIALVMLAVTLAMLPLLALDLPLRSCFTLFVVGASVVWAIPSAFRRRRAASSAPRGRSKR